MSDLPLLALCIAIPVVIGMLNGIATSKTIRDWYPTLDKPWWTPPNWLFGPVWTVLYVMMGTAVWLVWRQGWSTPGVPLAVILWFAQMLLNATWSPTFFAARNPPAALGVLLLMDVVIIATVVVFIPLSTTAALLMLPYLAWGLFATVLNISIVRRNSFAS